MKRKKQGAISSYFSKRANKDDGGTSSTIPPQSQPSQVSLQAFSLTNNASDPHIDESEETQNVGEKHVEFEPSSIPRDDAPTNVGRLSEDEINNLPHDPGKRRKMSDFHENDKDIVRRKYIEKKPCQPTNHVFPQTNFSGKIVALIPNGSVNINLGLSIV